MRALYRALVEARVLGERAGRKLAIPKSLEACWVGTLIDLQPGDLSSGPACGWITPYLRQVGARRFARAANRTDLKRADHALAAVSSDPASAAERALCAIGQAQALKAAGNRNLAIAHVSNIDDASWRRILAIANRGELPLVLVAFPSAKTTPDLTAIARRVPGPAIPVIPVDAGDAVALYRVAQETCLRARADGGIVVIECVATGIDPIELLASQLVAKGICTRRWTAKVEPDFRALTSPRL